MPNNEYANEPNQSRSEDIIQSILDGTEYDEAARSRIEYLLIELKNAIEGGGGGGGVTSYSPLTEKPKIDNHTLQSGNNTSSDLGLQTKIDADHKLSADVIDDTNSTNKFNVKSDWNAASGAAGEILNKPTLGTASAKNVPASGDAATGEVVLGSDTRLTDARNAKDVYNWAKQENKPSYSYSEIQNTPTIPDELADLTDDATHRTVTDTEKNTWNGKQNALTFDNAPTSNSDNPVKSGGVYTALSGKQNNLSEEQMAAANSGIDSTKVAQIETNKNNILLNWCSGKNLLPLQNGVYSASTSTITVQDGVATLKSVDTTTHVATVGKFMLKAGVYVLFNRAASNGDIRLINGSTTVTTGNPATFTLDEDAELTIQFYTYNIVSEITIKPMLVTKAEYDAGLRTFEPYALPNISLTNTVKEITDQTIIYNYIAPTISQTVTKTDGGANITITRNADNSLTINGTMGSSNIAVGIESSKEFPAGQYVFSGVPSASVAGVSLYISYSSGYYATIGDGQKTATVMFNSGSTYGTAILLKKNPTGTTYTFDNLTLYPMLVPKALWDAGLTKYQSAGYIQPIMMPDATGNLQIIDGGYFRLGNMAIVNMRIEVTTNITTNRWLFKGLPTPVTTLSTGSTCGAITALASSEGVSDTMLSLMAYNTDTPSGGVPNQAAIYVPGNHIGGLPVGVYLLSGTYLCK